MVSPSRIWSAGSRDVSEPITRVFVVGGDGFEPPTPLTGTHPRPTVALGREHVSRARRLHTASIALLLALALALSALGALPASSAPGDAWQLDDDFGTGGEVVTSFGGGLDEIYDVAIQTDGKIVAVGESVGLSGDSEFTVARYRRNGALDTTFGSGTGTYSSYFYGADDRAEAVAIDPVNGDIVIAGEAGVPDEGGRPRLAILILNSDGTPDSTAGSNPGPGQITDTFGPITHAFDVAIYPAGSPDSNAGKIVVTGFASDQFAIHHMFVARYLRNGLRDGFSFGNGQGAVFPDPASGDDVGIAVGINAAGKILVAAQSDTAGYYVARLNSNGSLDTTYGNANPTDGWFRNTCDCKAWGLAVYPEGSLHPGRVLVVGDRRSNSQSDMEATRLLNTGNLEGTFLAVVDFFGHNDSAREVLLMPNGKIVLVGWAAETGTGSSTNDLVFFALARLLDSGEGDASFGDDSRFGANSNKLVAGFAFGYDAALAGALQSDGDILAAGASNQAAPGQTDIDFALARFTGPGGEAPKDFKAKVHDLPDFQREAKPDTFPVSWSAVKPPSGTVTFDVRTHSVRYYQTKFDDWRTILTKTSKTKKEMQANPGTTVCFAARAHRGDFTTPWSAQQCTATPVDDRTLDQDPPAPGVSTRSQAATGTPTSATAGARVPSSISTQCSRISRSS